VQTCVIFNPSARGEKAQAFCSRLNSRHPQFALRLTTAPGQARLLAAQAVREGFPTIVAAGGDGTAHEVVNGIADVPGGFAAARLGLLPLGTVNVFARELGLPADLTGAIQVLAAGRETTIDLGRVQFEAGGSPPLHFLQLAGAGMDSRAIALVSWKLKKKIGRLAYLVAGLAAAREAQPVITVECERQLSGELVLLGNGRYYAGSFAFFPGADLRDGLLDACVFPKAGWRSAARGAAGLLTGRVHRWSPAVRLRSSRFRLASASRVLLQLDGENTGELPATIRVLPKALRVIVP